MYAVIVHAQPGAQANEVIPRLVPLLELREETIRGMCARGFVTVESSLSEEEGMFLLARLQAEGLPADLVDEASLRAEPLATSIFSPNAPTQAPSTNITLFDDEDWDDMMGGLDFIDDPITPNLPAEARVIPPIRAQAAQATPHKERAGWGALFPDLHTETPRPPIATPPSVASARATPPQPARTPPPSDSLMSFGAEPIAPIPTPAPPQTPPPPQPMSKPLQQPSAFKGSKLLEALGMESDELPPYATDGYDPRTPHSPFIARWLSILAPGSGQVYNGEDRLSLDYGLKFFLIAPWISGVRQAESRAEKIATFWAPRPKKDHVVRTLKYVATWYFCVASIIALCAGVSLAIRDRATRSNVAPIGPATLAQSVKEARLDVQQARIAGLGAVNDMMEELQSSRSEMSKEEHIRRLFLRGFEDCQRGHFSSCEETMRRVSELSDGSHRDALRLQTWAAMRQRGGQPVPLPEIKGSVRTLAEYELLQHAKQNDLDPTSDAPALGSPPDVTPDPHDMDVAIHDMQIERVD